MSINTFVKCEGAGNDFILIDDRSETFPTKDKPYIAWLCHRRFGIGADGVILLQSTPHADFQMRIFNSDGSEAPTCGNGLRCLVRFIAELGFPHKKYRILTAGQVVEAEFVGDLIRIQMALPTPLKPRARLGEFDVHSFSVGTSHAVVFVPCVASIDLLSIGSTLRHHEYFAPHGLNVNLAALQPDGSFHVRTFERGVEGETWACGTGAVAVVAASQRHGLVKCVFPGGELEIEVGERGAWMTGPANVVFRCTPVSHREYRASQSG